VLIKRRQREGRHGTLAGALAARASGGLDRRALLRRSGLAAGALAGYQNKSGTQPKIHWLAGSLL
jgi:hypothetical protein